MNVFTTPLLRGQKVSAFQQNNDVILESEVSPDRYKKSPLVDDDDMDVIAVFPLDHKILNRKLRLFYCYLALFAIVVLFCDFILLLSLAVHEFNFFAVFIGMLLLLVVPRMILDEREERHRRERSIFKIAPRGIYLDEVNASGSTILRCRTVYRFDDIPSDRAR